MNKTDQMMADELLQVMRRLISHCNRRGQRSTQDIVPYIYEHGDTPLTAFEETIGLAIVPTVPVAVPVQGTE